MVVAGKGNFDYEKCELLECSLVSVPSNTNALAKARALKISETTIRLAFGEHAEQGRRGVKTGEHADTATCGWDDCPRGSSPATQGKENESRTTY